MDFGCCFFTKKIEFCVFSSYQNHASSSSDKVPETLKDKVLQNIVDFSYCFFMRILVVVFSWKKSDCQAISFRCRLMWSRMHTPSIGFTLMLVIQCTLCRIFSDFNAISILPWLKNLVLKLCQWCEMQHEWIALSVISRQLHKNTVWPLY